MGEARRRRHRWQMVHEDAEGNMVTWDYEASRMSLFNQQEVLRRLGPLIAARMVGSIGTGNAKEMTVQTIAAFGDIKKEDHDFAFNGMLRLVQCRLAGVENAPWANVWNDGVNPPMPMFEHVELFDLYRMMWEVSQFTFARFFTEASLTLNEADPDTKSQEG